MKRISLIGRIRHLVNIFIVMQGILIALLTVFFLNQKYMDSWGIGHVKHPYDR